MPKSIIYAEARASLAALWDKVVESLGKRSSYIGAALAMLR
ncbi:MAG TPA: hypothetical protein VKV03_00195 [Candidatus Binataceae bacterium]|nr:hypothetical protein [Candidatus Binataceae bacterium]